MKISTSSALAALACLMACGGSDTSGETPVTVPTPTPATPSPTPAPSPSDGDDFTTTEVATFNAPWAITFVDTGSYALVTEKGGAMFLVNTATGTKSDVGGVPTPLAGGQGGLGDIIMARDNDTSDNSYPIYLSWVEGGSRGTRGAVVARGTFSFDRGTGDNAKISALSIIWRQEPKVTGEGHFSHRIALSPDAQHLFITSGERQKKSPAQDMSVNLGKVIRLNPNGSVPADNPFANEGGVTAQIWSLGHRNLLGIAFDASGRLWEAEMGPMGGDEVNLIERGGNYGWPEASNGSNYDGSDIPDHQPGDGFIAPKTWWTPSISPGSLTYYNSSLFPQWRNSLFIGALSGQALIRLQINGDQLTKADQWPMKRIREVEAGPDGALWLLEDGANARLLKLTPGG